MRNNLRVAEDRADEAVSAAEHLHRLRSLLLPDEQHDLSGLKRRIEALERSPGYLSGRSVPALTTVDGEELAAVMQPHFMRLATGGVAHALGALMRSTNRTIDALMSWRLMKLRLKAIITGQSLGELVGSELRQTEIRRIFLVVREAGVMLYHWSNEDFVDAPPAEMIEEIMTTVHVLTEFAPERQAVPLRAINLSDAQIVLQASARHVVAIEITAGSMTQSRKDIIGFACRNMLGVAATYRAADEEAFERETMAGFATPLVSRQREKKNRRANPAYILGLLALLGGVSWYGWRSYHELQLHHSATAIEQTIRRNFRPGDVVVDVVPDRAARRITVTGLGFGPGSAGQIERRARTMAAPYALDFNLVVRDLDGARLERDALAATLSDAQLALASARAQIDRMESVAPVPGVTVADPVDALHDWTRENALFFGEGTAFRDPALAMRRIDRLAALLAAVPDIRLRVAGFTDGDNRTPANAQLALGRATAVADALIQRGIGADRFVLLGGHRRDAAISSETGPNSPNARVEFSLAFRGE